jgi:1-acyl-sn-glycerol-3-phosphate acyltransferase
MEPLVGAIKGSSYTLWMCALATTRVALGSDETLVVRMTKQWAVGMCRRLNIEVKSVGVDHVDWSQPHVVMANHQSYLDVLALYRALPKPFGMIAKRELFVVPFFGFVMKSLGCVSIDRRRGAASHRSLHEAATRVRGGSSIVVFPEGTRSLGDRVKQFKNGPFHLVQAARAPIIPIGIRGSADLMSRRSVGIRSGVINVRIGSPIAVAGDGGVRERTALASSVRRAIAELAGLPLGE